MGPDDGFDIYFVLSSGEKKHDQIEIANRMMEAIARTSPAVWCSFFAPSLVKRSRPVKKTKTGTIQEKPRFFIFLETFFMYVLFCFINEHEHCNKI